MFKKFYKDLKADFKNKQKRKDSLYFLLFFLFSFFLIYSILNISIIYNSINYFFGYTSNFILNHIFLINSIFHFDIFLKASIIEITNLSYPIIINNLCTGILEFSLLSSAIISTLGFSILRKIKWVFYSILIVIFFNVFRISFTSFIILKLNLSWANFFHGFLFRLFLIIIVIGTYWFFYNYTKKKK